jgi:chemotaxis protein CheZ
MEAGETYPGERVLQRVGALTRQLHDSLRALGYDKALERAASEIPETRDRLSYIAEMTERAAERALNATEVARPIQDQLSSDAGGLNQRWQELFDRKLSLEQFKALVEDTRGFLSAVPQRTAATNAELMEIMMAQDFQDLTGQVIKRVATVTHEVEQQLVQLLLESVPPERRVEHGHSLMNGPVIKADGATDVVTTQGQVDDLLESLGF